MSLRQWLEPDSEGYFWLFVLIPLVIIVAWGISNFITLVFFGLMIYCATCLVMIKKQNKKVWNLTDS